MLFQQTAEPSIPSLSAGMDADNEMALVLSKDAATIQRDPWSSTAQSLLQMYQYGNRQTFKILALVQARRALRNGQHCAPKLNHDNSHPSILRIPEQIHRHTQQGQSAAVEPAVEITGECSAGLECDRKLKMIGIRLLYCSMQSQFYDVPRPYPLPIPLKQQW